MCKRFSQHFSYMIYFFNSIENYFKNYNIKFRATMVHFTFQSSFAVLAGEMRCPGLVLIPDRHAEICQVGLTHLSRCFHRVLFCSSLHKFGRRHSRMHLPDACSLLMPSQKNADRYQLRQLELN